MKKSIIMTALSLTLLSQISFAALPPGAESLRRIAAIASSEDVFNAFGSARWIRSIADVNGNGDEYIVRSSRCSLDVSVEVVPQNPPIIGPEPLKINVGKLMCR